MQTIRKKADRIKPNQVIICKNLKLKTLYNHIENSDEIIPLLWYDSSEFNYDIQIFTKMLKKIRERYGAFGCKNDIQFYIFIDNFINFKVDKEFTKVYTDLEKILSDTNISLIIQE